MDFIDRIGPVLGILAFLGLAGLAFLLIVQAREIRRLREWAGRAPERALEADEATQAAAEARGELTAEPQPGRITMAREAVLSRATSLWRTLNRRSPLEPRWLAAGLAALLIAAAVVTGGFGLLGEDEGRRGGERRAATTDGKDPEERPPQVAVLNATAAETDVTTEPVDPVPGLAGDVAKDVVDPAGFRVKTEQTAVTGLEETTVMHEPGFEEQAQALADAIAPQLGEPAITQMIQEVRDLAEGAPLALLVGLDNADFADQ